MRIRKSRIDGLVKKPKSDIGKYLLTFVSPFLIGGAVLYFNLKPDKTDVSDCESQIEQSSEDALKKETYSLQESVENHDEVKEPAVEELEQTVNQASNQETYSLQELVGDYEKISREIRQGNIVIDVTAPSWCGHCMPYAKSFKEASEKYRQKGIRFFDMNYDENKEIIDMLVRDHIFSEDIGGVPCTIFIRDGKEFYRVRGAKPDKLEQGIEKYF